MATREPKTSAGVPRETREINSLSALAAALEKLDSDRLTPGLVERELSERGYFEAGMMEQLVLLSTISLHLAGAGYEDAVISALIDCPAERLQGTAALAVEHAFGDDLVQAIPRLKTIGSLPGTWPRELAQMVLHALVIRHGVGAVLPMVRAWLVDQDEAVRRMVVEGFRPRGVMIPPIRELLDDPSPCKSILEPVLDDPADYVRKATANHLNDISRDNPEIALGWAIEWLNGEAISAERRWIHERGLRTLLKQNHPEAYRLLGYAKPDELDAQWAAALPETVVINELITMSVSLRNLAKASRRVLVAVHLSMPGRGVKRREAVYQLFKGELKAGQERTVGKAIHFVDKSTQRKEPGRYEVTVVVNGQPRVEGSFNYPG